MREFSFCMFMLMMVMWGCTEVKESRGGSSGTRNFSSICLEGVEYYHHLGGGYRDYLAPKFNRNGEVVICD